LSEILKNLDQNHQLDSEAANKKTPDRLACVDALRGFDMLWIIGGDTLLHLLAGITGWGVLVVLSSQMYHAEWAGLNAYDLIFPLFMFLSGVSLSLSLKKQQFDCAYDRHKFVAKAGRRMIVLIMLGIVYNFGWEVSQDRFRLASVLGQIGIAYFITSVLFVYEQRLSHRILGLGIVLAVTAILQQTVGVPGRAAGVLTSEGSINGWIDQALLPGRLYGGSYDPEGILNCFSASAVTMLGALISGFVDRKYPVKTIKRLLFSGVVLVLAGYALSSGYPIIKAVWTVPFSLVTAGISTILFALFFLLFDVLKLMKSGLFFSVVGINSIGIYLAARFLAYPLLTLVTNEEVFSTLESAVVVLCIIGVEWLALYLCFKKGWFLKV